jgi:hypothetical protein
MSMKYANREIVFTNEYGDTKKEKLIILQFPEKHRQDSFWFYGEIAKLGKYILIATGDIECRFENNSKVYKNESAVEYAYEHDLNDRKLHNEKQGVAEWIHNNWFEVVGESGETIMADVAETFDNGIELLKEYYEQDALGEYKS